ncbi:hypothetical protein [Lentzea fradiae]|uniref:hypothetical protein n=1 Tax=Lentzea fradiae TaxID=200378 RepID=UPI000B7DF667|nr:hypothetical protein [Lentzea fradiae]
MSGSVIASYTPGNAPEHMAAYERLFREAAVEGITFLFASDGFGGQDVEYPASSRGALGRAAPASRRRCSRASPP